MDVEILTVYKDGDDCLSRANFFLWHKRFSEGRERLEDDNHE